VERFFKESHWDSNADGPGQGYLNNHNRTWPEQFLFWPVSHLKVFKKRREK